MLKRCQILLADWQIEHMKIIAEKNDVSISEMVRIILCEGLIYASPAIHPEYREKLNIKKLVAITKEGADSKTSRARKHQLISNLYFETRKLTEYINAKLARDKKK